MQLLTCGIADHEDYADGMTIACKNLQLPDNTMNDYAYIKNHSRAFDRSKALQEMFGDDAWMYN
jgi:hypothetical protein